LVFSFWFSATGRQEQSIYSYVFSGKQCTSRAVKFHVTGMSIFALTDIIFSKFEDHNKQYNLCIPLFLWSFSPLVS
jgi:hypothetical protein